MRHMMSSFLEKSKTYYSKSNQLCTFDAPKKEHKYTLIFQHGLGDSQNSFRPLLSELQLDNVKILYPRAPQMPVKAHFGEETVAWFDIDLQPTRNGTYALAFNDKPGVLKSAKCIEEIIDEEIKCVKSPKHIFISGFSQGAIMALHVGLKYKEPLGGIMAFSGFYIFSDDLQKYIQHTDIPIFLSHGKLDTVISVKYYHATTKFLQSQNIPIEVSILDPDGDHCITPKQFKEFKKFFNQKLSLLESSNDSSL